MAVQRDRPYPGFNFLVDLGDGQSDSPAGGFSEVGGMGMEIAVIEYRNGNARDSSVTKLPGLHKVSDVHFKRGLMGSLNLFAWLDQIRNGDANATRTVTVTLMNEAREPVQTWRLLRARIVKHTSGPFNARGSDVAMEEMVLAYERLEIE